MMVKTAETDSTYSFGYSVDPMEKYIENQPALRDKEGKVFYGQEPISGESTTTECGVNYQLLAVITDVAQWGTPSCSRPLSDTDNGARNGRSN